MSLRKWYLACFMTIVALLLTSLYLEFFKGIIPCPLCTLQRCAFVLLGIIFLLGAIVPVKRFAYGLIGSFAAVASTIGLLLAGRQIWLQHFPTVAKQECGTSLQYMLEVLPVQQVLQKILAGGTECSQHVWEFLLLDMADWSFLWFTAFLLFSIYALIKAWHIRSF